MMGRTHVLIGISSLWLLQVIPHAITSENVAPLIALAALGALLPDLDAQGSTIKYLSVARIQPFAPLFLLIARDFGHRGATHSLAGLLVVAILNLPLALLWPWMWWIALLLGYASHLAADAGTRSGISLLYPRKRHYHLLAPRYRFITGSFVEEALIPLVALFILRLLLPYLALIATGHGYF